TGLHLSHETSDQGLRQTVGVDARYDDIALVGLYHTEARRRLSTTREDHVLEASVSPYAQGDVLWMPRFRTIFGLRADGYAFNVASSYSPFSGSDYTGIVSPKVSVILGPWAGLEVYANGGYGFHSNDARGARSTSSGASPGVQEAVEHFPIPGGPPIQLSPLLIRTEGAELGARLDGGSRGSLSAACWGLD